MEKMYSAIKRIVLFNDTTGNTRVAFMEDENSKIFFALGKPIIPNSIWNFFR